MPKRKIEPEEAIGPAVNGLEDFPPPAPLAPPEEPLPEYEAEPWEAAEAETVEEPALLLCGDGAAAHATAELAVKCGFVLEIFSDAEDAAASAWPEASAFYHTPGWLDVPQICQIKRNYFVCVFLESAADCEDIISQCLPSEARYLGVFGDMEKRREIFQGLRQLGAPDTELAAVACPMGLNIGAETPEQHAVGIVAQLMAVKAGTLKRLVHGDKRK